MHDSLLLGRSLKWDKIDRTRSNLCFELSLQGRYPCTAKMHQVDEDTHVFSRYLTLLDEE